MSIGGLSKARLGRMHDVMAGHVEHGEVPGIVTLVSRRGEVLPLMHQPGETWMYNTGSYVLGVLIARASGQPLETFFRERIFEPLGMKDTAFSVPAAKLDRLATCYEVNPETGALALHDGVDDSQWSRPPAFPDAGAGLVSTIDDYLAFGQMMLNNGKHGSERVLSRPSVETMTTDQLTPEQKTVSGFFPGYWDSRGWGFGVDLPQFLDLGLPDDRRLRPLTGADERESARAARGGAARALVWGHQKRAARAEHARALDGPRGRGRPSARALTPADGVWGHRSSAARAARAAREQRTGPQISWKRGRPSARALMPADGVWGHRKRAARAEHARALDGPPGSLEERRRRVRPPRLRRRDRFATLRRKRLGLLVGHHQRG